MKELSLKDFLHQTLKDIMSAVNADCGSLFLFDPEHKELVLDSFYNSVNLPLGGLKHRLGEGISGKVAQAKQPVLVNNIDIDSRFKKNGFTHYRTNSFISIPLFGKDGLLGLINLADKSNKEPFSEKDLKFAVSLSKYACMIVERDKYASVGKLAAGVVHEVNNPLDGIIRYTNILLNQVESDSIIKEYLMEVKKGLNRIANITKSLLEFSHQVNSHPIYAKEYVDVHGLIDECLDIFNDRINVNIRLDKKYAKPMPKILNLGLQHAFINLIKNALDAMPDGGRLEINTGLKGSGLEISFQDSGIGIPGEIAKRIFEPFFTTKAIDKGSGLGLPISKEIINKYDGSIEVDSSPGKGSKFIIYIPKEYFENSSV